MYEWAIKVKNDIETFLKEDVEHQSDYVYCVLVNPDSEETITIAGDGYESTIIFTPYTTKENGYEKGYSNIPEWDFNFDNYVFEELEKGYFVGYMSDDMNYGIWNSLKELYPEDIDHKNGVQSYLQYCADNGITKTYLDEKTVLDTPDAMQYFEGLAINEIMTYKGYVIEADDLNLDNSKENLVNIYKSNQDFEMKEPIETVSLNTIGLKQNIKEYIDDVYIDKTDLESEKSYLTFVLGYDLLNDMIKKYGVLECDTNFEFCDNLASQFLDSKEYSNFNHSSYEMLQMWLSNNKEKIETEYKKAIEFEDKVYNGNLVIIDKGFRKEEPIALIEKDVPSMNRKEYIVAFNYTIDENNNSLSWGYGRYYYDKNSGQEAYQKVINGGNLAFHDRDER